MSEPQKRVWVLDVGNLFAMAMMMIVFGFVFTIMFSQILKIASQVLAPSPQTVIFERDSEGRIIAIHYVSAK